MCGRSTLTKNEKEIEERFNSSFYTDDLLRYNGLPSFNVAPTHFHPVITEDKSNIKFMKWGLIPSWAKDSNIGSKMINARVETLTEKVSFKNIINSRRCLIPFDGYYEWKKERNLKIPYYLYFEDKRIFTIAGIWTEWKNETNTIINSFSAITQTASSNITDIHERMPAILDKEKERIWLDHNLSYNSIKQIISPDIGKQLCFHRVSDKVNKVINNDLSLIEETNNPLPPIQATLF